MLSAAAGLCKKDKLIRIIGEVEDFGGVRRILATDLRPLSSGNELTNHFLEVSDSCDKHVQRTQLGKIKGGAVDGLGNVARSAMSQGLARRSVHARDMLDDTGTWDPMLLNAVCLGIQAITGELVQNDSLDRSLLLIFQTNSSTLFLK